MGKGKNVSIPIIPKTKIVTTFKTSVGKDVPIKVTGKKGK